MKNEERLLAFLEDAFAKAGEPEEMHLSSHEIAKNLVIKKNKLDIKIHNLEVKTTPVYVNVMLRSLEQQGKIKYDRSNKRKPIIKLIKNT